MTRWLFLLLPLAGCVVIDGNDPPFIHWAEATCSYAPYERDWLWTFEAEVSDLDGTYDVDWVDVHVYRTRSEAWVDSFGLDRTTRAQWWSGTWAEASTRLTCGDDYLIDFVAEDSDGAVDIYTVRIRD